MGRNAVDPVYEEGKVPFEMDEATVVTEGNKEGNDVAIIACGEMVKPAKDAAEILKRKGIHASVLDMYCVKPLDEEAVIRAARKAKAVLTVEEHSPFGGDQKASVPVQPLLRHYAGTVRDLLRQRQIHGYLLRHFRPEDIRRQRDSRGILHIGHHAEHVQDLRHRRDPRSGCPEKKDHSDIPLGRETSRLKKEDSGYISSL